MSFPWSSLILRGTIPRKMARFHWAQKMQNRNAEIRNLAPPEIGNHYKVFLKRLVLCIFCAQCLNICWEIVCVISVLTTRISAWLVQSSRHPGSYTNIAQLILGSACVKYVGDFCGENFREIAVDFLEDFSGHLFQTERRGKHPATQCAKKTVAKNKQPQKNSSAKNRA